MVPGTVKDQITLYDDSIPDEAVKQAAKMVGLDSSIEALEHGYDTICTPEVFSQGQWAATVYRQSSGDRTRTAFAG